MNTLQDNIKWFRDFNLNLGVNVLGGIFGVFEAFSDSAKMLRAFCSLVERCEELKKRFDDDDSFAEAIYPYLYKLDLLLGPQKAEIVSNRYVPFYLEAKKRLESCPEFVDWIKKTDFEIMPDIFSKCVMLYAIQKIQVKEKMECTGCLLFFFITAIAYVLLVFAIFRQ